jgi:excinuclease ABC subunit A
LEQGAIDPWRGPKSGAERKQLKKFCELEHIPFDRPWHTLTATHKQKLYDIKKKDFWGINPWFGWLESKVYKMHVRVFLSRYRTQVLCESCHGTRLVRGADLFRVQGKNLPEVWETPVSLLISWLEKLRNEHSGSSRDLLHVIDSLHSRLVCLNDLGLPYLALGRESRTLSGGETQRVNLASALGSGLSSTQFVLDEPSIGLHPRDNERLISSMHKLRDAGNSVLTVEHDLGCIDAADYIIELGPKAGSAGGEIVYAGSRTGWQGIPEYEQLAFSAQRPSALSTKVLAIRGATARNLKSVAIDIPVSSFTCISGISGSGKSTLVEEIILKAWRARQNPHVVPEHDRLWKSVEGLEHFSDVSMVDQSGLARSPRANIATYSKIWDYIRTELAETEAATARALDKSSFSFNVDGGRCPECNGAGSIREDMQFLSDVYVLCEVCLGKRFQESILDIRFMDKNAHEWLSTTVDDCCTLLPEGHISHRSALLLQTLGLGHIMLGHPLSELSGGEAQRLKLVPYIAAQQSSKKAALGAALLIFDEPTTGLHLLDVQKLLGVFRSLTDFGHTVLCIEHNQECLLSADYLIDLGPEGGAAGGELLLAGKPADFLKKTAAKRSPTALYMQRYLEERARFTTGKKQHFLPQSKAGSDNTIALKENLRPSAQISSLRVLGANEHNLKNIDVEIPHDTFVAITGVSGSGKSTLAKDIIYSEGQRRYLDCLSPYARQFIRALSKPDIRDIENVRPTVCVYQHTFQPSVLSTVGTMSEAYNFLRLLYSKLGDQYCPDHPSERVRALSAAEIAEEIHTLGSKTVRFLAPVISQRKGLHKTVFQRALRQEIAEVRVDGRLSAPADHLDGLERNKAHSIEFVTAKFIPARVPKQLIETATQEAFAIGGGSLFVLSDNDERVYSHERACPVCRRGFLKPDPEDLSFSSRRGRCQKCSGSGVFKDADCPSCMGTRLAPLGRNVRVDGLTIAQLSAQTAAEIMLWCAALRFETWGEALSRPILEEIASRLKALCSLGLDYLPLNRGCRALSGGELQRLRLASAMGTPLSGAMYIFDEPSAGLHPLDTARVLKELHSLKDSKNSVLLIEHDIHSIFSADYILEIGPGGGRRGGEIVYSGKASEYPSAGALLQPFKDSEGPSRPSLVTTKDKPKLTIKKGKKNNIQGLGLNIPLQTLTSVIGVSGAGKSSLVHGIVLESLLRGTHKSSENSYTLDGCTVTCEAPIDRVLEVDSTPIGKNSRSTPASYLGIWDGIRKIFASAFEAKARGWDASYFSYNSGEGRCPECKGLGRQKMEMSFLSEAWVTCDRCEGKRYRDETLMVTYQGKSIAEILQLTFDEALELFANHPKIHRIIHYTCILGLGYLSLGQSSSTLSGGESQRLKLVTELSKRSVGHTLYILDEPSIGLHRQDVGRLLNALRTLVQAGNSVMLIEHDEDLIMGSDYLIELGPGPGEKGGKVIFEGEPRQLVKETKATKSIWAKQLNANLSDKHSQFHAQAQNVVFS